MSGTDIGAILLAATGFVAAVGRGVAWLLDFVTKQADKTILALQEENAALQKREELLEKALRQAGVEVPK